MKNQIFFILLFISSLVFSQIPAYYNDVNLNLTGIQLKNELASKIISTHIRYLSYSNVWNASKITDLDPSDYTNTNVLLIYGYNDNDGNYSTDRTRNKNANGGNTGTDWNREHTYAKSLGTPNLGTSGPGSDAHHLRPSDVYFNSIRGNKKFAAGNGNAGNSNGGWYPGDEWKGDIARMMMYMYLRYGNQCKPTGVGIGNSSNTPDDMIDIFLQWNAEDPVSQVEINRNTYHANSTNTYAQGNRNPFIDNPAFATQIWGGPQAEDLFENGNNTDTQAPSTPTNLTTSNITETSILLSWNASTDNVGVTDYDIYVNNIYFNSTATTSFNVTNLTQNTNYSFYVKANDASENTSNASTIVTATTLPNSNGGGNGSDLFISEYIEGSSYNKAIEIVNITGNTVNLSEYKIKKQPNGAGSWSSGYNLSGQLANGNVLVIANSNASTVVTTKADIITTASEMSFNGNDPVGLFKNEILIDIVGNFNGGSTNFAKDKTLQRKTDIINPNNVYNVNEWTIEPQNTFDNLGVFNSSNNGGGNTGGTPTIIMRNSFETGWESWNDGGGDCYRSNTSRSFDGNYSIRIRDNSGIASAMTSSSFNISSFSDLQITFSFYSFSMENNEDFWLRYFDGSTWHTIKHFVSGTDFYNNEFTTVTVTINNLAYNFSTNSKLRFQCDASSNYDQIYIDNVVVKANNGGFQKTVKKILSNKKITNSFEKGFEVENIKVYPNPSNNYINVKTEFDLEDKLTNIEIKIVNMQGKLIKKVHFNNVAEEYFNKRINISDLNEGLYFINISNDRGYFYTTKLVVAPKT